MNNKEIQAECKKHFQMGLNSAKVDGRVRQLQSSVKRLESENARLYALTSAFEAATGHSVFKFKDKESLEILSRIMELKENAMKIEQMVAIAEAAKEASDSINARVQDLFRMPGVKAPDYDEDHCDYFYLG